MQQIMSAFYFTAYSPHIRYCGISLSSFFFQELPIGQSCLCSGSSVDCAAAEPFSQDAQREKRPTLDVEKLTRVLFSPTGH